MKFVLIGLILSLITGCSQSNSPSQEISLTEYEIKTTSITPTDLGEIVIPNNKLYSLSIKNTGTENLIGPATVSGAGFSLAYQNCSFVKPKTSCSVKVFFDSKNQTAGLKTGQINLDSLSMPVTINVKDAVVIENVLEPLPASLDFGTLTPKSQVLKSVTFKNISKTTLTGTVTVDAPWVIMSNNCSSLKTKTNCVVKLLLNGKDIPTGQTINGILAFGSHLPTVPLTAKNGDTLSATVVAVKDSINYNHVTPINLGVIPKNLNYSLNLSLRNTSIPNAIISDISFSSQTTILTNLCHTTLAVAQSCAISANILPTGVSPILLNLKINGEAKNYSIIYSHPPDVITYEPEYSAYGSCSAQTICDGPGIQTRTLDICKKMTNGIFTENVNISFCSAFNIQSNLEQSCTSSVACPVVNDCNFENAVDNGVDNLFGVLSVKGSLPNNCLIDECENNFTKNINETKCDLNLVEKTIPADEFTMAGPNLYLSNEGDLWSWSASVSYNYKAPISADRILSVSSSLMNDERSTSITSNQYYIIYEKNSKTYLAHIDNDYQSVVNYNLTDNYGGVAYISKQSPCFVNNIGQYFCFFYDYSAINRGLKLFNNSYGTISKIFSNGFVLINNKIYYPNEFGYTLTEFSTNGNSTAAIQIGSIVHTRLNNNELVDIFHKQLVNNPWILENSSVYLHLTSNRIQTFASSWSYYSNTTTTIPFNIRKIRMEQSHNSSYNGPHSFLCAIGDGLNLACSGPPNSFSTINVINLDNFVNNNNYPITKINDLAFLWTSTNGIVNRKKLCFTDQYNLPQCLFYNGTSYIDTTVFMGSGLSLFPVYQTNYIHPVRQIRFKNPKISGMFSQDGNILYLNGSAIGGQNFNPISIGKTNYPIELIDSDFLCYINKPSGLNSSITCQSDLYQFAQGNESSRFSNNTIGGVYTYSLSGMNIQKADASQYIMCVISEYGDVLCKPHQNATNTYTNRYGQLGLGNTTTYSSNKIFEPVLGNGTFDGTPIKIEMGLDHSCFLTSTGKVYCWGLNSSGQIGDGTITNKLQPTLVDTSLVSGSIVDIYLNENSSCLLNDQGKAYCWGDNSLGQLGFGHKNQQRIPKSILLNDIIGSSKIKKIVTGIFGNTCSLLNNYKLYCWGQNIKPSYANFLIGLNGTDQELLTPNLVNLPVDIKDLSVTKNVNHTGLSGGSWAHASIMCGLTLKNERLCFGGLIKDSFGLSSEVFNYGKGFPEKVLFTP